MKHISFSKLSEIMREKRKALSLSQEDLQSLTAINRQVIGRIELGKMVPSISQLEEISKALQFSIDDLFVEEEKLDVFYALRGQAKSGSEIEDLNHLFSMILCLNQQKVLRRRLGDVQE